MSADSGGIKVVVADNSVMRSGMVAALKRMAGLHATPFEVQTTESLRNYVLLHSPQVVIASPTFGGYFDVHSFKENEGAAQVKYVAMLSSVIDKSLLKDYDDTFSIYDDPGVRSKKSAQASGHEALSEREREIVVCVVKGMTNKEIADQLCLSIHTVITHRRNISHKLQIHSPAGLTIYAIVNKLIEITNIKEPAAK